MLLVTRMEILIFFSTGRNWVRFYWFIAGDICDGDGFILAVVTAGGFYVTAIRVVVVFVEIPRLSPLALV